MKDQENVNKGDTKLFRTSFTLNKQYNSLNANLTNGGFLHAGTTSDTTSMNMSILGDGELIYNIGIMSDTSNTPIELDVSNVDIMTIGFSGIIYDTYSATYGIAILSDAVLS